MKQPTSQAAELLELAGTMNYDLQLALSAAGRAGAELGNLSPAELQAVAIHFSAEQARRDQAALTSFQQLETETQERHLKALFGS